MYPPLHIQSQFQVRLQTYDRSSRIRAPIARRIQPDIGRILSVMQERMVQQGIHRAGTESLASHLVCRDDVSQGGWSTTLETSELYMHVHYYDYDDILSSNS